MLSTLLPFLLFTFVASITPGPTNILVLNNSARYGLKAALPLIIGACSAATGVVLLVGCGVGQSLTRQPALQLAMQWIGILWLTCLAWQIYRAPAGLPNATASGQERRIGLLGAAGLQLVNPKVWMMALAMVGVFGGTGVEQQSHILQLSLAFFLICVPCMSTWALLGAGSSRLLRSPRAMQRFNRGMALLLVASAWSSLWA